MKFISSITTLVTTLQPGYNPKRFEHNRWYGTSSQKQHANIPNLTPEIVIPTPWRDYMDCKHCSWGIRDGLFENGQYHLRGDQKLILAGCFTRGCLATLECIHQFQCNAKESDMRIWRHATLTNHRQILIHNRSHDPPPPKYVDIHVLISLLTWPRLSIPSSGPSSNIMAQLYNHWMWLHLVHVRNHFFQHADFITGVSSKGSLSQTKSPEMKAGFLRLVGTAY